MRGKGGLIGGWVDRGDEQRREMEAERGGIGGATERHKCIEASAVGLSKVHYLTIRYCIAIGSKHYA